MPSKWETLYDDSGTFKEVKHLGNRKYLFIEVLDLLEHMSEREVKELEGRFVGNLSYVDLSAIPEKEKESIYNSCGYESKIDPSDICMAEMSHDYGNKAPLGTIYDTTEIKCKKAMRREAKAAVLDLKDRLGIVVYTLGCTAFEYMQGDINSAIERSKDQSKGIVITGTGQKEEDNRPDDWLPYVFGYQDAISGKKRMESEQEISSEYYNGYNRGINVGKGMATRPTWIG